MNPSIRITRYPFMRRAMSLAVGLALCTLGVAHASVATVSTSLNQLQAGVDNQGWWSNVRTNSNSTNDNYITGSGETYRSFFSFDLSGLSGVVTAASFDVRRYNQLGAVTLGLWDVSTTAAALITTRNNISSPSIFSDLGSGVSYGVFTVSTGASADILNFSLNAAALADINSRVGVGYFSVGAALQGAGSIFASSGDEPGNSAGARNSIQNLVLTMVPGGGTVPEPGSLALVGLALAGLGLAGRGRNKLA